MPDYRAIEERLLAIINMHPDTEALRLPEAPQDEGDMVFAHRQKETAVAMIDCKMLRIINARAALERLRQGDYGICLVCGKDIGKKRLAAVPEAPLCCPCQTAAEARARFGK